jgi:hypothetical protein
MAARISWSLPIVTMLAAVVGMLVPQQVRADLEVFLQEDAGPKVLVADNPVDFDPLGVGYNGYFGPGGTSKTSGDFLINFFGAASTNAASESDLMSSTTSIKNLASKSHTLTIYVSQDDYSLPGSAGSTLVMTSHIGGTVMTGGVGQTLTFQSYSNNSNGLFDTTGATTTGPQSPVVSVTHSSYDSEPDPSTLFARTSGLYSVTTSNAITLVVGGTLNFATTTTLELSAIPAPAGLVLALTAVPALAVGGWLRRRTRKAPC